MIENIPRINIRYADTMRCVTSFMYIDIEYEEKILKIKILGHPSYTI